MSCYFLYSQKSGWYIRQQLIFWSSFKIIFPMLQKQHSSILKTLPSYGTLSVSDAEKLVHAFMTSRLDYCNALLGGYPACSINKLQIVQNVAARFLTRSRKYDLITPILQSLHWLPIKFRISYKILLLAYKALNDLASVYLTSLLSCYNPTRSLRAQNSGLLAVPRIAKSTKGGRTFQIWLPNSGIAFLITFRVQTHSLYLNLD